jgi:hypothetical protein
VRYPPLAVVTSCDACTTLHSTTKTPGLCRKHHMPHEHVLTWQAVALRTRPLSCGSKSRGAGHSGFGGSSHAVAWGCWTSLAGSVLRAARIGRLAERATWAPSSGRSTLKR